MNAEWNAEVPFNLRVRTKRFALQILRMSASLPNTPEAWVVRRQVCRSGTSVGAQYREACRARSKAEFISKMESALQELDETSYWLELAVEAAMLSANAGAVQDEADQLIRIFVSSIKRAKHR